VSAPIPENYHQELSIIANLFLVQGSPKELNIPDVMRKQVLKSISASTSPQNLEPVASHVYLILRSCSHRNFIRLGVSNGTFETLCMATGLGIVLTAGAFLGMFLLAFVTHASRWRGLCFAPMWAVGAALILAGLRGSCFFLLLFSRRQPLPWERFDDSASVRSYSSKVMTFARKLMILDRKIKVKDIHLRRLQRKIVIQSIAGGVSFAAVMETFFLLLPIWR
jgi:putative Mn2+ efflux pump MntP